MQRFLFPSENILSENPGSWKCISRIPSQDPCPRRKASLEASDRMAVLFGLLLDPFGARPVPIADGYDQSAETGRSYVKRGFAITHGGGG
jgi:hypothetical protein